MKDLARELMAMAGATLTMGAIAGVLWAIKEIIT